MQSPDSVALNIQKSPSIPASACRRSKIAVTTGLVEPLQSIAVSLLFSTTARRPVMPINSFSIPFQFRRPVRLGDRVRQVVVTAR